MATEPTVIRRYTPPTCSLAITAQPSALSRWMGKQALKDLRFKLSFDDPRLSDDAWVILRGAQTELEALSAAVSNYVQAFLLQPSAAQPITLEHDIAAQTAVAATEVALPTIADSTGISIHPRGFLNHELTLGALATDQSGPTLTLSSTQLADLAAALDEYSAEATTLPSLEGQVAWLPNLSQWSSPNWASLAAGLLVAVGLGTSLVNGLSQRSPSSEASNQASSSDQRLAVSPAPAMPPPPDPFATLPPLATLPNATMPSPGLNANPTITPSPGLNGNALQNDNPSAPIIANVPATPSQPQVNIFDIPQPAAPKVASQPSASPPKPPTPVIVDDIGSGVMVEPVPDMTQANANKATKPSAAALKRSPAAEDSTREPAIAGRSDLAEAPAPPQGTNFFDNVQAASVQRYFEQRWKPPTDLTQGIQYRIELNADGSLKRVEALGAVAEKFREKTGMPAIGTALAPAAKNDNNQTSVMRLLLDPDGAVKVIPQ